VNEACDHRLTLRLLRGTSTSIRVSNPFPLRVHNPYWPPRNIMPASDNGASFLGLILSTVYVLYRLPLRSALTSSHRVYGVTCLQVYSYFVDGCSGDSTALKAFVVALMCVSHTIMMASR
jgi:hypothetical protein